MRLLPLLVRVRRSLERRVTHTPPFDQLCDMEGGPLGGRHAAVMPALPEDYDVAGAATSPVANGSVSRNAADGSMTALSPARSRVDGPEEEEMDEPEVIEVSDDGEQAMRAPTSTNVRSPAGSRTASRSPIVERIHARDHANGNGSDVPGSRPESAAQSHPHSQTRWGLVPVKKWNLRSRSNSLAGLNNINDAGGRDNKGVRSKDEEGEEGEEEDDELVDDDEGGEYVPGASGGSKRSDVSRYSGGPDVSERERRSVEVTRRSRDPGLDKAKVGKEQGAKIVF
jgi:hypothetical protein